MIDYDELALKRILDFCIRDENGCLIFKGTKTKFGYGRIEYKGKLILVHRLIMHLKHGFDLDSELLILHNDKICKSRACCEDNHLSIGTYTENKESAVKKGSMITYGMRNASKTHCSICGEPLSGDNLIKIKFGRACRNCQNRYARESRARRRLEA